MAKIAVLVAQEYEDSELLVPIKRLTEAGHEVELLGTDAGRELVGKRGKTKVLVDAAVADRRPEQYDALLIPGGHSPDHLRIDAKVIDFVKGFGTIGRPIAAVCHGPQLLIEADLVRGRKMTAWPSVRTDLRNAGAEVVDKEVVRDGAFITSRKPEDLEAFSNELLEVLAHREGTSDGQAVQSRPAAGNR
jgi:protease I